MTSFLTKGQQVLVLVGNTAVKAEATGSDWGRFASTSALNMFTLKFSRVRFNVATEGNQGSYRMAPESVLPHRPCHLNP